MRSYAEVRPWASHEERIVSEALSVGDIPGAVIQVEVRPPLPQIVPFPPRYGYRTTAISIFDVLDVSRFEKDRRTDFSGGPGGWQAAARNVNSTWW